MFGMYGRDRLLELREPGAGRCRFPHDALHLGLAPGDGFADFDRAPSPIARPRPVPSLPAAWLGVPGLAPRQSVSRAQPCSAGTAGSAAGASRLGVKRPAASRLRVSGAAAGSSAGYQPQRPASRALRPHREGGGNDHRAELVSVEPTSARESLASASSTAISASHCSQRIALPPTQLIDQLPACSRPRHLLNDRARKVPAGRA